MLEHLQVSFLEAKYFAGSRLVLPGNVLSTRSVAVLRRHEERKIEKKGTSDAKLPFELQQQWKQPPSPGAGDPKERRLRTRTPRARTGSRGRQISGLFSLSVSFPSSSYCRHDEIIAEQRKSYLLFIRTYWLLGRFFSAKISEILKTF